MEDFMRRMLIVAALGVGLVQGWAIAQESPRAKKTRESLKKIVLEDLNWKDEMTHVVFSDISRECDKKVTFEIDTNGGMSRNTRLSYKVKKASLEKVLNDLADQNDFGWYVYTNPKDPNGQKEGRIILRKGAKGKERGYEFGTEPKEEKKKSSLDPNRNLYEAARMSHIISAMRGSGSRWNFQAIPGR
jgi:hypothetical protein